jgi:hypothetical protein
LKTGEFYRGVFARLVRLCRALLSAPGLQFMSRPPALAAGRWPLVAQAKR